MGGVLHAKSPCELPQNERQVSYVKQKSKICGVSTLQWIPRLTSGILMLLQHPIGNASCKVFALETLLSSLDPL